METIVAPAARRSDLSWGPVMLLGLAFAINYADRQFFFAVFPQIQSGLGLSNTQLGLAGSVFAWSYALVMPLAGYVADRVPRHRVVIAALLLWSLATLGTSLSQNLPQLLFWRVMMGLTEALFMPAAFGMVATLCSVTARSRALSTLGLAQFVGLAIGGIYGGWSAQRIGWRHASQTLVLAGLLYAGVLVWRFWAFPYETNIEIQEHRSVLKTLRSLPFFLLAATFCAFCAMLWLIYAWLPTVVHERYSLGLAASGVTSTLYLQIGSAFGVIAGGFLGDWAVTTRFTSRLEVALGGIVCCSPFAYAIFAMHSRLTLQIATFCFGLSSGVFIANTFSCLYDFTDRENLSFATGCLNMLGGAGAGIAILLAGVFKNTWGIASLMTWILLTANCAAISLAIVARRTRKVSSTASRS